MMIINASDEYGEHLFAPEREYIVLEREDKGREKGMCSVLEQDKEWKI